MHHRVKIIINSRAAPCVDLWARNRKSLDCVVFRGRVPKAFEGNSYPLFLIEGRAEIGREYSPETFVGVLPYHTEFNGHALFVWAMMPCIDSTAHYLVSTATIAVKAGEKTPLFAARFGTEFHISGYKILKRGLK